MAIEKTPCLVLSVMPYRESSLIVTLFSRVHGRVNGIAKGVRRKPTDPLIFERGFLVELVLYVKANRDLHTIGASAVTSPFPSIRSDLGKIAVRDAVLEIILRSLRGAESHPDLFDFAAAFLGSLDGYPSGTLPLPPLMRFIIGWMTRLGFHLDLATCVRCGRRIADEGGVLWVEQGGILCAFCSPSRTASPFHIPPSAVRLLTGESVGLSGKDLPLREQFRIARLFADCCRYHADIRCELKSFAFIADLLAMEKGECATT